MRKTLLVTIALLLSLSLAAPALALPPRPGGSDCQTCSGSGGNRFCKNTSSGGWHDCEDYYGQCTATGGQCVDP